MSYKIAADIIMVLHFAWIVFMIYGLALTIRGFWRPAFFERSLFRSIHLLGILFVGALTLLGHYCPLTVWENQLRRHYNPDTEYPGSFIITWIERLVYPDVDPVVLSIPTIAAGVFVLIVFILRPPAKLKRLFQR